MSFEAWYYEQRAAVRVGVGGFDYGAAQTQLSQAFGGLKQAQTTLARAIGMPQSNSGDAGPSGSEGLTYCFPIGWLEAAASTLNTYYDAIFIAQGAAQVAAGIVAAGAGQDSTLLGLQQALQGLVAPQKCPLCADQLGIPSNQSVFQWSIKPNSYWITFEPRWIMSVQNYVAQVANVLQALQQYLAVVTSNPQAAGPATSGSGGPSGGGRMSPARGPAQHLLAVNKPTGY